MRCKYGMAWTECRSEAAFGLDFCVKHHAESIRERCWCGAPSVKQCCAASSFVCGAPLCVEHECRNESYGMTGSYGNPHSKKGRAQYEEWTAATTAERMSRDANPAVTPKESPRG